MKNLKMQRIEYDDYSLLLNMISLLLPQSILIIVGVTNSDNQRLIRLKLFFLL